MDLTKDLADAWIIHENAESGRYVYGGTHPRFGLVACKVVKFHTDNTFVLAQREANISLHLTHPGACPIHETEYIEGSGHGYLRIIMPYVASDLGKQIAIRFQSHPKQQWEESAVWNILAQVVDVLSYAQEVKICHRDIKPQNILMDETGRVKLADFGSGKDLSELGSELKCTVTGTFSYFSPEMHKAYAAWAATEPIEPHNHYKSDVYSLGLTVLHMLALQVPTALKLPHNLQYKITAMLENHSKVYSPELLIILGAMLEVNPIYRPDFLQLRDMLVSLRGPLRSEVLAENFLPHPRGMFQHRKLVKPAAIVATHQCDECRFTRDSVVTLQCSHRFCKKCLGAWKHIYRNRLFLFCSLCSAQLLPAEERKVRMLG